MTFAEQLAEEEKMTGRLCQYVNGWEHRGHGHHVQVLLYEHASEVLGPQLRLSVAIDGRIATGSIVGSKGHGASD